MTLLPKLEFKTFETGFIRGVDAAQGVHTLKLTTEVAKEWNELVAVQIDLTKAFDRIHHETVTETMRKKVFVINSLPCCARCGRGAK